MINLNQKGVYISIRLFQYGKTNAIIKIGHKMYVLEIDKTVSCTNVATYRKSTKTHYFEKYAYDSEFYSVYVKNEAILDKDFFENIKDISNAQKICDKYHYALSKF